MFNYINSKKFYVVLFNYFIVYLKLYKIIK